MSKCTRKYIAIHEGYENLITADGNVFTSESGNIIIENREWSTVINGVELDPGEVGDLFDILFLLMQTQNIHTVPKAIHEISKTIYPSDNDDDDTFSITKEELTEGVIKHE